MLTFFNEQLMTDEQKMEEGKRMFSIFAARMFESRVLDAYREKVAQERQKELLRELEEEDSIAKLKEAKKAKENQRKKDKKKYVTLIPSFSQKKDPDNCLIGRRSR